MTLRDELLDSIEAAKLALAEAGGESPPFILQHGTMYIQIAEKDTPGRVSKVRILERPWKATRLSKQEAAETALEIENAAEIPVSVSGWREATNRFIRDSSVLIRLLPQENTPPR